jgi:hypothetical protein
MKAKKTLLLNQKELANLQGTHQKALLITY